MLNPAPAARGGLHLVSLRPRTGLLRSGPQTFKRLVDIVLASALGICALPLGILIAIAIVLDSRGPVFFMQRRMGRGNRTFRLWKFRSMVADAGPLLEEHLARNPASALEWRMQHKLKDDPRITRVGRILRRTSLDELPQLWNVIRGDMSMVGPRPIVKEEVHRYGSAFALYSAVAPGLTGLWQVSGRNETSYRRRVELDSEYITRWTAGLDARVLLRTVRVVLGGRGAY